LGRASASPPQEVRFCRSADGVRIAYAVHGSGPPLLISTCWLSHLQYDWDSPVWRHFLADLGRFATIIRFDERGYGLSDWDVTDFSLEMRLADLEAVAEDAGYPPSRHPVCDGAPRPGDSPALLQQLRRRRAGHHP
jgi:pimeloyl-ACP methyl ester carboxylesterase